MTIPTPEEAAEALIRDWNRIGGYVNNDPGATMALIDDLARAFRERDRAILDEAVLVVNGAAPFTAATNAIAALRKKVLGE